MRLEYESAPFRVDERMPLTSFDLLSSIVTSWPTGLGCLNALTVDNRARGAGLASDPFAIKHDQCVIDLLEASFVPKLRKPAIDRAPRRQITRQQAPRAARPHDVEDAIDDLAHRPLARPACRAGLRHVRRDHAPLCIGQIGLVSRGGAAMLLSSGWCPHGEVQGWFKKPLGITTGANDSTLFKNCRLQEPRGLNLDIDGWLRGIGPQQYARTFSDNLCFVTLPMSASVATLSLHSRSSVIP